MTTLPGMAQTTLKSTCNVTSLSSCWFTYYFACPSIHPSYRKEGVEISDDNLLSMQLQSVANSWFDIYTLKVDRVAC